MAATPVNPSIPPTPSPVPAQADLVVKEIRIEDFRGLQEFWTPLRNLTVFVGENNVGKTSILQALSVFFGNTRPSEDDLYVSSDGSRAKAFTIDVRFEPANGTAFSGPVRTRIGQAIQLASGPQPEFYAIRAVGKKSPDGVGLEIERRFLQGWATSRTAAAGLTKLPGYVRQEQELVAFFLLDARRDLVDELRNRSSHWGRVLSDVAIPDDERLPLEAKLSELGSDIVEKSPVLVGLKAALSKVKDALGGSVSDVAISPLPGRVEELVRAVDVLLWHPMLRRCR